MDISVSQLNHRLALQLPVELPLGLVFVTGTVRNIEIEEEAVDGRPSFTSFDLEQKGHRLHCKLVQREAEKTALREQVEVRLGGHLSFDPRQAAYYLLARDAEIISPGGAEKKTDPLAIDLSELVDDQAAFASALAGIKRRADVSRQSPTSVPVWVQKIAPPEWQESEEAVEAADEGSPISSSSSLTHPVLNEGLVSYLSALMESEEEVELTPDILAQWVSGPEIDIPDDEIDMAAPPLSSLVPEREESDEGITAVSPYAPVGDAVPKPKPVRPKSAQPQPHQQTDWLIIALLVVMIILTILMFGAIILLRS